MIIPSSARFFLTVHLHPPSALVLLGMTLATGIRAIVLSPAELDSGLAMLLFAQMFLASSGFLGPARRGHFDPLLVGTKDRTTPIVWHWVVSVAPGIASWICLAATGYFLGSPAAVSALVGSRAAALVIVSALAWALGFALARGAGGAIWMAALLALLLTRTDLLASASSVSVVARVSRHAVTLLVCPFLLLGKRVPVEDAAICSAALLSVVFLLSVWRIAARLDIFLVHNA